MQNLIKCLLALSFFCTIIDARAFELSKKAQISVITGAPGTDLYALYGHSAIRVYDPMFGFDLMYNYGTFDFDTPNFYLKFAQGKLNYMLSKDDYNRFLYFYSAQGRSVFEQVLNLEQAEKQQLFDYLENNYKPENRFYLYDFFYDNCSSRIRDVLQKALPNKVFFDNAPPAEAKSFRDLINPYVRDPWVNLGINLILGFPADKITSPAERMFLPDQLLIALEKAKIKRQQTENLAQPVKNVFQGFMSRPLPGFFTPFTLFWGFFGLMALITLVGYRKQKIRYGIDFTLFLIMGLIGCFFLLLWFGSDHKVLKMNLNMLWAFPLHLPIAFFLLFKNKPAFLKPYFLIVGILQILLLLSWGFFPQKMHWALFPLVMTLATRCFWVYMSLPQR
jgi:hypothetical protein